MKKNLIIASILSSAALLGAPLLAQPPAPPAPPAPPVPPISPAPGNHHEKLPKVPVTWLGVETSDIPRVVSEQLGLPKGFGLVVDYVVPDGPAAAAGIQTNDIIKLLNDQILVDTDQLSKLVRSYSEGTTVTLTVLRKSQEQKIPVKLGKKEITQHHMGEIHIPNDFMMGNFDMDEFKDRMNELKEQLGANKDVIQSAVMRAHEEVDRARERAQQEAEKAREKAQEQAEKARERAERDAEKARDQAQREGERAREQAERERERAQEEAEHARDQATDASSQAFRNGGKITITNSDQNGTHTTHIDLNKAQIVFSDDKGELRIDNGNGKKILTAKDPQGRLLFSGPVETKEDIDKLPPDVRDRFNKLQQKDLPSVGAPDKVTVNVDNDNDNDNDNDADEMDDEGSSTGVQQMKFEVAQPVWRL